MKQFFLLIILLFNFNVYAGASYPETPKTTGHLCSLKDRDFQRLRYKEKIPYCFRNVKYELKTRTYLDYDVDLTTRKQYTIDHIIPLSFGGSNHPDNLYPQHKKIYTAPYEREIYEMLERGTITQQLAIRVIMMKKFDPYRDWNEIKREVLGR